MSQRLSYCRSIYIKITGRTNYTNLTDAGLHSNRERGAQAMANEGVLEVRRSETGAPATKLYG